MIIIFPHRKISGIGIDMLSRIRPIALAPPTLRPALPCPSTQPLPEEQGITRHLVGQRECSKLLFSEGNFTEEGALVKERGRDRELEC
ncbi:hypothetical protein DPEC_G00238580 [Dallia pectoralis]|uniref:Uncharacterized protein n=1 Tax=Dallia pectoralis TaxID=75939 RepID=A0ACC2FYV4_DALPE|nr:hypothetical protein DPEC_G00238580 [Dallia pectoralis]